MIFFLGGKAGLWNLGFSFPAKVACVSIAGKRGFIKLTYWSVVAFVFAGDSLKSQASPCYSAQNNPLRHMTQIHSHSCNTWKLLCQDSANRAIQEKWPIQFYNSNSSHWTHRFSFKFGWDLIDLATIWLLLFVLSTSPATCSQPKSQATRMHKRAPPVHQDLLSRHLSKVEFSWQRKLQHFSPGGTARWFKVTF